MGWPYIECIDSALCWACNGGKVSGGSGALCCNCRGAIEGNCDGKEELVGRFPAYWSIIEVYRCL
jgi:hypothetical protein